MKNSLKAALLSALVLPGAGHLLFKRYVVGFLFGFISLSALAVIVIAVLEMADAIVDHINNNVMQAEMIGIREALSHGLVSADTATMNMAFVVYLFVWFLSILDAYRLGDRVDKEHESENHFLHN